MSDARATLTRVPALGDSTHTLAFSDHAIITVEAELVGPKQVADDDPEPSRFCPEHPDDTTDSCGGCYRARMQHDRWKTRHPNHHIAKLIASLGDVSEPSVPDGHYNCRYCRDGDVVLNSSGEPISGHPACDHTGRWVRPTSAGERADR